MEINNNKKNNDFWKVTNFRFTVFPIANYKVDENWWQILVGTPPDKVTYQPKLQVHHFEGLYKSGVFIIDLEPTRVHLIYTPSQDQIIVNSNPVVLGNYSEIQNDFKSLVTTWLSLSNCPIATRIAYGGMLENPVESKSDGYSKLSSFLPNVKIDIDGSSDFLYQINRPRKSIVYPNNLNVNRLSKWAVILHQTNIAPLFSKLPQQNVIFGEFTASLEFDINTSQDFNGLFSSSEQKSIFNELLNLGDEISEKGDIA